MKSEHFCSVFQSHDFGEIVVMKNCTEWRPSIVIAICPDGNNYEVTIGYPDGSVQSWKDRDTAFAEITLEKAEAYVRDVMWQKCLTLFLE